MPRNKRDFSQPYAFQIFDTAYVKEPCIDIIHDFKIIYPIINEHFQDEFIDGEEYHSISNYEKIKDIPAKPTHKNRLYIVNNLCYVPMALFDLDEPILAYIMGRFSRSPYYDADNCAIYDPDLNPSNISILFIFADNELIFHEQLPTLLLIHLLIAFHKENQIDTSGIRQHFYAGPRRKPDRLY